MATREDLQEWVIEVLRALGGKARIVEICKYIWEKHESDLRHSRDLMYTWEYDVRWAGQVLRNKKVLKAFNGNRNLPSGLARAESAAVLRIPADRWGVGPTQQLDS